MPRKGWKKPPGYGGYKHNAPKSVRGRTPTAGPAVLRAARARAGKDVVENQQSAIAGSTEETVVDDGAVDAVESAVEKEALISSRLRCRKSSHEDKETDIAEVSDDEDVNDAPVGGGSVGFSSDDDEYVQQPKKKKKASVSGATARVVDDDPMEDIPLVRTDPPASDPNTLFPVNGDLPLLDLSVTLSKQKGHVLPGWLNMVYEWMRLRCKAGAAALERGGKQQHLHVQIMLRMHVCSQDLSALRDELKALVGWRRGDGSGIYCQVKEFTPGQTWEMMLGYVHKDQSQPHFDVRLHNIDNTDVLRGIADWQTARLSYEDGMIVLSKGNMFQRLATWRMNAHPESDNTFLEDMTEMLNTRKYMVSSLVVTTGQMRLNAAEAMWKLVKGTTTLTTNDTRDLLFAFYSTTRPGAPEPGERYFNAYPEAPQNNTSTISASEGFLTPQATVNRPPPPAPIVSPFVRNLLAKRAAKNKSQAGSSSADASIPIRPDSPLSVRS